MDIGLTPIDRVCLELGFVLQLQKEYLAVRNEHHDSTRGQAQMNAGDGVGR